MAQTTIPDSHRAIFETQIHGYLSTFTKDGAISTNPVSVDLHGDQVKMSTLKSRVKYRNMLANPNATLCVVDAKSPTRYIEIRGTVELVDDPGGEYVKDLFRRQSGGYEFDADEPGAERVIVTLTPNKVSTPLLYGGRFD